MKKLSQKGFTLVEVLLLVIALSAVIGVGYYVYSTSSEDDTNTVKQETSSKKQSTNEQSKSYLKVEELGIKIPLNEELEELSYVIPQEGGEVVLTSKKLAILEDAACGSSDTPASIGRIMSVRKVSGTHDSGTDTEDFFLKQFNGFYIVGSYGNLSCGDASESTAIKNYIEESNKLYESANKAIKNSETL